MSKLPKNIRKHLNKEAYDWDASIAAESAAEAAQLIERAQPFEAYRPPRQPVSLRIDPFDLALLKRLARKKGLPHTQLMAMWLHERIEKERNGHGDRD
jgi:predicted DNA binding CopG/RHH family protein